MGEAMSYSDIGHAAEEHGGAFGPSERSFQKFGAGLFSRRLNFIELDIASVEALKLLKSGCLP